MYKKLTKVVDIEALSRPCVPQPHFIVKGATCKQSRACWMEAHLSAHVDMKLGAGQSFYHTFGARLTTQGVRLCPVRVCKHFPVLTQMTLTV